MTRDEQYDAVMNYEALYRAAKKICYAAVSKRFKRTDKQHIDLAARALQREFGSPFTIAGCREIAAFFVQELIDAGEI